MYRTHRVALVLYRSLVSESGVFRVSIFLAIVPFCAGTINYFLGIRAGSLLLSTLVPAMVLFVGFSMNAVVLLLRYAESSDADPELVEQARNISVYLVTFGIIIATVAFAGIIWVKNFKSGQGLGLIPSSVLIFLLTHYVLVALLFPTRIFTIVEKIGRENFRDTETQNDSSEEEEMGQGTQSHRSI
jgi:hypothetical protein